MAPQASGLTAAPPPPPGPVPLGGGPQVTDNVARDSTISRRTKDMRTPVGTAPMIAETANRVWCLPGHARLAGECRVGVLGVPGLRRRAGERAADAAVRGLALRQRHGQG